MTTREIVRKPLILASWIFVGAVLLHFVPSHGIRKAGGTVPLPNGLDRLFNS